jgi:hypothetical protein
MVTFAPGLRTAASGGRIPSTSLGVVALEVVVGVEVVVVACVDVVDEEECESPQPAAARTHTTASMETRQFELIRLTPNWGE